MAQPSDLPKKPGTETREAQEAAEIAAGGDLSLGNVNDEARFVDGAAAAITEPSTQLARQEIETERAAQDEAAGRFEGMTPEELIERASGNLLGHFDEQDITGRSISEVEEDPTLQADGRPIGPWTEFAARAGASLSFNPEQALRIAQRTLGNDFNVFESDSGEIKYRKKGSKKTFTLDKDFMEGGFREVLMDVLADNYALLAESATAIGVEGASIAAGTAIFPGVGTAVGIIGGVPLSALAATQMRKHALEQYGETFPEGEFQNQWEMNTYMNAAGAGVGLALGKVVTRGAEILKDLVDAAPTKVVKQLAEIRQSFDVFLEGAEKLGMTKAEAGEHIFDAVDTASSKAGKQLGVLRDEFLTAAGDQKLLTQKYPKALVNALKEELGVDPNRLGLLLSASESGDIARASLRKQLVDRKALGDGDAAAVFADDIIDELRRIQDNGGMSGQEFLDTAQFWKQPAGFSPRSKQRVPHPKQTQRIAGQIRKAISEDEFEAFETVFNGTDKAMAIRVAKKDFSEKIQIREAIGKVFDGKRSAEKSMDALLQPGTSKRIKQLKTILGEDSREFKLLRTAWMEKIHKEVIDPKSGIVVPGALRKQFDKMGDDMINEFITPQQKKALELINKRAEKVPALNMAGATDEQFVKDAAAVTIFQYNQPGIIVRMLWGFSRGNSKVAKYLADDGILDIATKITDPTKKSVALEALQAFRVTYRGARKGKGKSLIEVADELELDEIQKKANREAARKGVSSTERARRTGRDVGVSQAIVSQQRDVDPLAILDDDGPELEGIE